MIYQTKTAILASSLLLGLPGVADAKQRALQFAGNMLAAGPSAIASQNSMILPANGGSSNVDIRFQLPPDYKNDTPLQFRVYANPIGTPCYYSLEVDFVQRLRLGFNDHLAVEGVTPVKTSIAASDPFKLYAKTFALKGPSTAPFSGIKRGDIYTIRLVRDTDDPGDTCSGDLYIFAVQVRYTMRY